jgi:hypothetical protein
VVAEEFGRRGARTTAPRAERTHDA